MSKSNESEILKSICEYLEAKRYFFWRQNTVGVYDARKRTYRKPPKYAIKGVSDIIMLKDGTAWFLETKDKARQSKEQKEFGDNVRKNGGEYHIVKSIAELIKLGL